MVDGYCKGERIGDARNLFDIMPERNVVTWTAMIYGHMRLESFKYGIELLFKCGWDLFGSSGPQTKSSISFGRCVIMLYPPWRSSTIAILSQQKSVKATKIE